ncbi:MAG TPA: NUDIX domain-containing protein [Candidatus Binatia bacterium]|nr:NUDIX domain-containing protein [Candidatus Binatia bacterium]
MSESTQPTWKKEISAGGIVFKEQDGRVFILLIMPKGPNYGPPAGYWTFPKGLLDHEGEDMKETAVREVKEEGGVNAEVLDELGYIKYFRGAGSGFPPAIKFVHYFLMKYLDGDPQNHDEEVAEATFVPVEEVEEKLKFKNDKEIFGRATEKLNKKN